MVTPASGSARDAQYRTLLGEGEQALAPEAELRRCRSVQRRAGAPARFDGGLLPPRRGLPSGAPERLGDARPAGGHSPGAPGARSRSSRWATCPRRAERDGAGRRVVRPGGAAEDRQTPAAATTLALARYRSGIAGRGAGAARARDRAATRRSPRRITCWASSIATARTRTRDRQPSSTRSGSRRRSPPAREELADLYRERGRHVDEMLQLAGAGRRATRGRPGSVAIGLAEARRGQFDGALRHAGGRARRPPRRIPRCSSRSAACSSCARRTHARSRLGDSRA